MTTPKRIIQEFTRQHRVLATGVLVSLLLSNLLNVLLPLSIGLFYETGMQRQSVKGSLLLKIFPMVDSNERFFIFFGILVFCKAFFYFFEKYWTGVLGERFSRWLRERAFEQQMRLPMKTFSKRPVGNYLLRYSGDLNAIREFVNKGVLMFAGDMFFLLCAFGALLAVQPYLASIVIGIWLSAGGIIFLLSRRLQLATYERRGQRSRGLAFVSQRLHAFYTVKSFNREKTEIAQYSRESEQLMQFGIRFFKQSASIQSLFPLFFYGTLGVIMWLAWYQGAWVTTGGDFFAFMLLLLHFHSVLQRVLEVNLVWQSGMVSLKKLSALLNNTREKRGGIRLDKEITGRITFQNVVFGYQKSMPVFTGLNFSVEPDSITLLTGKHGTGKSTLFQLIQKIHTPQKGEIFLDDTAYAQLSGFELRKHIAIVSQDAPLLGKTVLKAIAYRESTEKRERIKSLLDKLNFSLTPDGDPDKTLNWRLEENGTNLSSGENTLLQIARALFSEKKILLFDEPFAALDSRQAGRVARILNRLKQNHTILIIAKRPPSRLEVDHTITLDSQQHEPEDPSDIDPATD